MNAPRDPAELRRRAAELRLAANHAERRRDAQRELEAAALLEAEADLLEGKAKPAPTRVEPQSFEGREKARRARVEKFLEGIGLGKR